VYSQRDVERLTMIVKKPARAGGQIQDGQTTEG